MHLLEQSNDGEERGRKAGVPFNRGPEGRSLRVTDRQADTHREICASMSRHGRKCSGPYGIVHIATIQGGSLNAVSIYFCSQTCTPCTSGPSDIFPTLLLCFALLWSRHIFELILWHETTKRYLCPWFLMFKTIYVPNLYNNIDAELLWSCYKFSMMYEMRNIAQHRELKSPICCLNCVMY